MQSQNLDNLPDIPGIPTKINTLWKRIAVVVLVCYSLFSYFTDIHKKYETAKRPPIRVVPETVMLAVDNKLKGPSAVVFSDCIDQMKIPGLHNGASVWLTNPQDSLRSTARLIIESQKTRTPGTDPGVCLEVSREVATGIHLSRDNVVSVAELRTGFESDNKHINVLQAPHIKNVVSFNTIKDK